MLTPFEHTKPREENAELKRFGRLMKRIFTWCIVVGGFAFAVYTLLWQQREVIAYQVSRGSIISEALGTGSIESRKTIELGFELTGRVTALEVDQGDHIVKGQRLAAIDPVTYEVEVSLAEQEVAYTQSTSRRLAADIDRAKAVLEGAQDNIKRIRPQVAKGASSAESLDVAEERVKVAAAELVRSQAALVEGSQLILSAKRRLDRARADLTKTIAYSPIDGIVIRREREVGDIAAPGTTILRIASTETIWASVWVDETYLNRLKLGLPSRIALRSAPDQMMAGTVVRIGKEVDRETRELLVDVAFKEAPNNLIFGQRVDLWIELARKENTLRIPAAALAHRSGSAGTFVEKDGRCVFLKLKLGERGRDQIEILSGIEANALVVLPVAGDIKPLKSNQRIKIVRSKNETLP